MNKDDRIDFLVGNIIASSKIDGKTANNMAEVCAASNPVRAFLDDPKYVISAINCHINYYTQHSRDVCVHVVLWC